MQSTLATPQTIVGMDVRDIVGELVWTQIEPYLDSVAVDNTQTLRYTRQVENEIGRLQHIEAVLRPHEEKGVLKGVVALMTDVSHHHLATQQIRDSEERMRKFAAITTEAIVLHRDGSSRTAMTHWPGWLATRLASCAARRFSTTWPRSAPAGAAEHAQRARRSPRVRDHPQNGQLIPVEIEACTMPGEKNGTASSCCAT
jgi:hypothetical protein